MVTKFSPLDKKIEKTGKLESIGKTAFHKELPLVTPKRKKVRTRVKVIGPIKLNLSLLDGNVAKFKLFRFKFREEDVYDVAVRGNVRKSKRPLVRIHSACSFGDVWGSQRCDCGEQLKEAINRIAKSKAGMIVYMWPHEGRAVGLWDHARVYAEQDKGENTYSSYKKLHLPIDKRDYHDAIEILKHKKFKIKELELLTNNPRKINAIKKAGIVVFRVPFWVRMTEQTLPKIEQLGHLFP